MADCLIVKRADRSIWSAGNDSVTFARAWYGKCPKCNKLIKGNSRGYTTYGSYTNSRKTAKDALHFHMKTKH